ncbi:hypothetical protein GCM10028791_39550 [Echinicola sediminis]
MAQAQNNITPHTIQVTGKSEILITPDEATVAILVQTKALKASDASAMLNKKSHELEQLVKKSRLTNFKLSTSNYNVSINRIYQKGSSKDSGYVASQNLKITLNNPQKDLVQLIEQLNKNEEITYHVAFQVSDEMQAAYEKQLLTEALNDAHEKAALIAETMELEKIKVYTINYTSTQGGFPRPMQMEYMRAQKSMADAPSPVFSPEEQTLSDEVQVTFVFTN